MLGLLPKLDNTDFATLSPVEKRMLQMFYVTLWGKTAESWEEMCIRDRLKAIGMRMGTRMEIAAAVSIKVPTIKRIRLMNKSATILSSMRCV